MGKENNVESELNIYLVHFTFICYCFFTHENDLMIKLKLIINN